jgi:hypothetical protein
MVSTVQRILIFAAILLLAGVVFPNVYNSIVDAQNWGAAIPQSIEAARAYFAHVNPGHYYRTASPAAQIAALAVLIATWRLGRNARLLAGAALILAISGDIMTFAYFYPRNAIMFGPDQHSVEVLQETWAGWNAMNWVRSGICCVALICELNLLSLFEAQTAAAKLEDKLI